MRATLIVAVIAGLVAVIVVGAVVGRLLRDAASAKESNPPADAAPASRAYPLSRRELEVAVLIAQGLTSREVGRRLGIEKGMVEKHLEHIKRVISNF